jgi:hypothetical protein
MSEATQGPAMSDPIDESSIIEAMTEGATDALNGLIADGKVPFGLTILAQRLLADLQDILDDVDAGVHERFVAQTAFFEFMGTIDGCVTTK